MPERVNGSRGGLDHISTLLTCDGRQQQASVEIHAQFTCFSTPSTALLNHMASHVTQDKAKHNVTQY